VTGPTQDFIAIQDLSPRQFFATLMAVKARHGSSGERAVNAQTYGRTRMLQTSNNIAKRRLRASRCLYRAALMPIKTYASRRLFITIRSIGHVSMTRRRNKPQTSGEVDRHRIIDRLEATVRHPRREPESAAWGVSPIDSYLRDRLDSPGSVGDR
jgi:hypothetical protein